ncbi:MAG: glycosyltransferase [Angustibacter sp.]
MTTADPASDATPHPPPLLARRVPDPAAGSASGPGPLRVLLLLGTSAGGTVRHVRSVAAGLVAAGHRVVVAGPTDLADHLRGTGSRHVPVPIAERPRPVRDLRTATTIRRLARDADVVHAHGVRAGGLTVLALCGVRGAGVRGAGSERRGRPPLVVTMHNAPPAGGGRGARLMYGFLERLVVHGADVIAGVSADLRRRVSRLGASDVRSAVIAAPAPRASGAEPDQLRRSLGVVGKVVVLCVARLTEQKALPLLLDAVELMAPMPGSGAGSSAPPPARAALKQVPELVVLVAGDGPLREPLAAQIDARSLPVRLLGWRDDVGDLLAVADVVVSPAAWEGQPIAVQQALHAGAAIVATDVGGTREVTGEAALLVPPCDAVALAAALSQMAHEKGLRDELRRRARQRAYQLPDDRTALSAVLVMYADLLGRA